MDNRFLPNAFEDTPASLTRRLMPATSRGQEVFDIFRANFDWPAQLQYNIDVGRQRYEDRIEAQHFEAYQRFVREYMEDFRRVFPDIMEFVNEAEMGINLHDMFRTQLSAGWMPMGFQMWKYYTVARRNFLGFHAFLDAEMEAMLEREFSMYVTLNPGRK